MSLVAKPGYTDESPPPGRQPMSCQFRFTFCVHTSFQFCLDGAFGEPENTHW